MKKENNLNLLYVEDEEFIRKNAVLFLEDEFQNIYEASNANEALKIYNEKKPDIIITDISMPKMSGLELCEEIRKKDNKTPIIITTAYSDTKYLLKAVELNLVKYLIKPIEEESLFEALQICFEKINDQNSNIINLSDKHKYDIFNHTLTHNNTIIKLTQSQTLLLELLIKHKNRVVTYQEIENHLYYDKGMSEDALKSLVRGLRSKINKELIENFSKIGYKIHIVK
jgi:DNA-binding response OmpR family regulator